MLVGCTSLYLDELELSPMQKSLVAAFRVGFNEYLVSFVALIQTTSLLQSFT